MEGRGRYGHGVTGDRAPEVSVVILTTGARPAELRAAVDSALRQDGPIVEIVVVANGTSADLGLPSDDRVRIVSSAENLGIPGGRNFGAAQAVAPVVAFLDDDARLIEVDTLAASADAFAANPQLGVVALRIVDDDGQTARRHVPRVGAGGADRSGPATAFLGGAVVIRREAFERAGRYPTDFRYAMEETDLALRLVDDGWTIQYESTPRWSTRGPIRRGIPKPVAHHAQPRVARLPQPSGATRRRLRGQLVGHLGHPAARPACRAVPGNRRRLEHPAPGSTGPDPLAHRRSADPSRSTADRVSRWPPDGGGSHQVPTAAHGWVTGR